MFKYFLLLLKILNYMLILCNPNPAYYTILPWQNTYSNKHVTNAFSAKDKVQNKKCLMHNI